MRLRDYRLERKLTLRQIATALGISESSVCLYEKGLREPNLATLKKLAKLYGCKIDDLVD